MNKKQKTDRCREILYSHSVNEIITNSENVQFLLSIFEGHSEWEAKQGIGVKSISIAKNKFNTCFQINRLDGTFTDISFTHCITKRSPIADIKKASRTAIRHLVVKFRDVNVVFGSSICPITNEILTKENTHIDHFDLPFNEMFNLWVADKDINYLYSKVNESKDNSVVTCFTDVSIIQEFIKFHNSNSKTKGSF